MYHFKTLTLNLLSCNTFLIAASSFVSTSRVWYTTPNEPLPVIFLFTYSSLICFPLLASFATTFIVFSWWAKKKYKRKWVNYPTRDILGTQWRNMDKKEEPFSLYTLILLTCCTLIKYFFNKKDLSFFFSKCHLSFVNYLSCFEIFIINYEKEKRKKKKVFFFIILIPWGVFKKKGKIEKSHSEMTYFHKFNPKENPQSPGKCLAEEILAVVAYIFLL